MRSLRIFVPLGSCAVVFWACGSSPPPEDPLDFVLGIKGSPACALACDPACSESTSPWVCPALDDWSKIPHDPTACGSFDGKTYPAVVPGKCVATDPSGSALAKAQVTTMPIVLPDGRRLQPVGNELVFETDGGFPASQLWIPGTRFLAINDNGYHTQSLRIVDTAMLKTNAQGAEVSPEETVVTALSTAHEQTWGKAPAQRRSLDKGNWQALDCNHRNSRSRWKLPTPI